MSHVGRILARGQQVRHGALRRKAGVSRRVAESTLPEEPAAEAEVEASVQAIRRGATADEDEVRTARRFASAAAEVSGQVPGARRREEPRDDTEETRSLRREPAPDEGGAEARKAGPRGASADEPGEGDPLAQPSRLRRSSGPDEGEVRGLEEEDPPEELASEPAPSDARARRRDTGDLGSPSANSFGFDASVGEGAPGQEGPMPPPVPRPIGPLTPGWLDGSVGLPDPSERASAPAGPRPPQVTIEQVDVTVHEPVQAGTVRGSPFRDRARLVRARFARRF